jgi:hypothetical protein
VVIPGSFLRFPGVKRFVGNRRSCTACSDAQVIVLVVGIEVSGVRFGLMNPWKEKVHLSEAARESQTDCAEW